eukprot:GHVT01066765.1.p1 GENE.GHVT01066765.1~~GHVT01066765.1.p1  ORF type:complete len:354 (-),score=93.56 GHVT01066765.1:862-1923(-)
MGPTSCGGPASLPVVKERECVLEVNEKGKGCKANTQFQGLPVAAGPEMPRAEIAEPEASNDSTAAAVPRATAAVATERKKAEESHDRDVAADAGRDAKGVSQPDVPVGVPMQADKVHGGRLIVGVPVAPPEPWGAATQQSEGGEKAAGQPLAKEGKMSTLQAAGNAEHQQWPAAEAAASIVLAEKIGEEAPLERPGKVNETTRKPVKADAPATAPIDEQTKPLTKPDVGADDQMTALTTAGDEEGTDDTQPREHTEVKAQPAREKQPPVPPPTAKGKERRRKSSSAYEPRQPDLKKKQPQTAAKTANSSTRQTAHSPEKTEMKDDGASKGRKKKEKAAKGNSGGGRRNSSTVY